MKFNSKSLVELSHDKLVLLAHIEAKFLNLPYIDWKFQFQEETDIIWIVSAKPTSHILFYND